MPTQPSQFPAMIELSTLNGNNGFKINGIAAGDGAGGLNINSAGDINNDTVADLIIGARFVDPNMPDSGQCYLIFGGQGIGAGGTFELSSLDGNNGFKINGEDGYIGESVSYAGDVNGDGIDDLIVGGHGGIGQAYVIFGSIFVGNSGTIEVSELNGGDGFKLNGNSDWAGYIVSNAGDINADGIDGLITGALYADPSGMTNAGRTYVVFGGNTVGSSGSITLASLNGNNGFIMNGLNAGDESGSSVSGVGDINADGVDDFISNARRASPNGASSGQTYVAFGSNGIGAGGTLELSTLDGSNGYMLNGIMSGDLSGFIMNRNEGDINNDGVNDIIIGAPNSKGQVYVVFGGTTVGSNGNFELSNLNGTNGYIINGIEGINKISLLGDVNDDGNRDFIISNPYADPNGVESGQCYLLFGGTGIADTGLFEISNLNITTGLIINGVSAGDKSGVSVSSAGDVNADGIDDIFIAAHGADPNGADSGQSYIIFGGKFTDNLPHIFMDSFIVSQGASTTLTTQMINVLVTPAVDDNLIIFNIKSASAINFELVYAPGFSISTFTQQQIKTGEVLYRHDGSLNQPSFSVSVDYTAFGPLTFGPCTANITFNYSPQLINNQLFIREGETIVLSSAELTATDLDSDNNQLQFRIENNINGQFEFTTQPGITTNIFTQGQINVGNVQFVADGSEQPPTYQVSIFDGFFETLPITPSITFITVNDVPEINRNQFRLNKIGSTVINNQMLSAQDEETPSSDLVFTLHNMELGRIERVSAQDKAITSFIQAEINAAQIRVVPESHDVLPKFNISVSDGSLSSTPIPAQILWETANQDIVISSNTKNNTVRNAVIGSVVSGFIGLLFLAIKIYVKRKSDKQMAKALEGDTESAAGQRAQYFKEVISPVAKKVLGQFSIKNFFGISDKKLGEFLDAVAKLIGECQAKGVPVNDLPNMEPAEATSLINEIAKQAKQVLVPTSSRTGTVLHFFKRQITPEQIEDASIMIASFVKTAWDSAMTRARGYSQAQGVEMTSLGLSDTAAPELDSVNPIFGAGVGAGAVSGASFDKLSQQVDLATLLTGFREEFNAKVESLEVNNQVLQNRIEQLEGKRKLPPPLPRP